MQSKSNKILILFGLLCSGLHCNGTNIQDDSLRSVDKRLELIQAVSTFGQYLEIQRKGKSTNLNPVYSFYRTTWNVEKSCPQCPTCGYAVGTWFKMAGLKLPLKNVGLAYNYTLAKNTIRLGKYTTPEKIAKIQLASVMIIRFKTYPNNQKLVYRYHVGLITDKFPTYAITKEANTSNSKTADRILQGLHREGEFYKIRPYTAIYKVADWLPEAKAKKDTVFEKKLNKFTQTWQLQNYQDLKIKLKN